ncbi:MAG: hypothetical protein R3F16_13700 [Myxococcota bacterium]
MDAIRTRVRFPPPPPPQRIRTAFRAVILARGRCEQRQRVERRLCHVVGPPDLALRRLQLDLPEQRTKQERRALRSPLQHLLHPGEPLLDPLDGRRLEDLLGSAAKLVQLLAQGLNPALRLYQGLAEGLAAPPFADEVDEVGEAPLFGIEFRFLRPDRLGDVRVERGDFRLDALEQVADVLGLIELLPDRLQDDCLRELPTDEHLVLAGALRGTEAAVVATSPSAHLGDRRSALPAQHRAREQVRREVPLPATLIAREAAPPLATRPAAAHFLAPGSNLIPQRRRHDAQRLVLLNDPLGLGLREPAPSAGTRVTTALGLVPHPATDVLLVVEDPAHGRGRPAFRGAHPPRDLLLVEHPNDSRQR